MTLILKPNKKKILKMVNKNLSMWKKYMDQSGTFYRIKPLPLNFTIINGKCTVIENEKNDR